jgi:Xaa-Pro dipeptidase
MHDLSYMVMAEHMLKLGILRGGSAREIVDSDVMGVFQPHGLGHFMGHDVHDCGGYGSYDGGKCSVSGEPVPERSTRPGFRSLRTSRVLQPGMVVTIEPGLYRIPALLEQALADPAMAKYIDSAKLDEIMPHGFGGIRIEDDVIITADGAENMSNVPRTVEEVEAVMAGGEWKVW